MAPANGVGPPEHPSGADTALIPFTPAGLPSPHELLAKIKEGIDEQATLARTGRSVTCPEDTHALIRELAGFYATAADYLAVFEGVQTHVERHCEEELLDAVGPRRGSEHEPARPMTVPHDGMKITVSPVVTSESDVDIDAVLNALALEVAEGYEETCGCCGAYHGVSPATVAYAVEVAQRAIALHRKTAPSVTAVKAFAAQAGSHGHDDIAATVNSAVRPTRREYRDRVKLVIKPAA